MVGVGKEIVAPARATTGLTLLPPLLSSSITGAYSTAYKTISPVTLPLNTSPPCVLDQVSGACPFTLVFGTIWFTGVSYSTLTSSVSIPASKQQVTVNFSTSKPA